MIDPELYYTVPTDRQTTLRILPGDPVFQTRTQNYPHYPKPVIRYFWRVVIRGREEEGVKIWSVSQQLHRMIVEGIVDNPVLPTLTKSQKFYRWLSSLGVFGWTPFRRLAKYVPVAKDCLDYEMGYDFVIQKDITQQVGKTSLGIPQIVKAVFLPRSVPAGTAQQIEAWRQGEDVFTHLFLKGVGQHGDEID